MKDLHPHLADKEHVIWDWNGTLLNDLDLAIDTINRLLVEDGLPTTDLEAYKKIFGFPVSNYYLKLGFDPAKFVRHCELFNDHFYAGLGACDLWPGARETLAHVVAAGKTQSLLSASEHNMLLTSVERFELNDMFHNVVGIADKLAGSKVARGHELIARVDIPLSKTVLIGDTDHDFEVGRALGIDVILVEHGHQSADRLRAVHSKVLRVL